MRNFEHASVYASGGPPVDVQFEIWGAFYGVVPVDESITRDRAQILNDKVSKAIGSRVDIFCRLLNLVLRQDSLQPWQEIDVALTALATLLEGTGLHGALEAIRPEVERVKSLAGGNGPRC